MEKVVQICEENDWKYICGFEPDFPEDIRELQYMLNPEIYGLIPPKLKKIENLTVVNNEPTIARNEPCPCGSGKKYKKCCLNK